MRVIGGSMSSDGGVLDAKKAPAPRAVALSHAASFVAVNFGNVEIVYHAIGRKSRRDTIVLTRLKRWLSAKGLPN